MPFSGARVTKLLRTTHPVQWTATSPGRCELPRHASGKFTIQDAVNAVRETGGTVCIGVGQYALAEPIRVTNARALRIKGQGAATMLVTPGAAFIVDTGIALAIEDLAILSLGRASAIRIRTVIGLSLQRLIVFVLGSRDATGAGISLGGIVLGATIRDNAMFAPTGIQGAVVEPGEEGQRAGILLSAALRIESNVLWCERSAIALAGQVLHAMAARIDRNDIVNCRRGAIAVLGLCGPGASMRITDNQFNIAGAGISAAVDGLWITGNKLADKVYYSHSGFPGGIKSITAEKLLVKKPEEVIRKAVKGMLPKNKLARHMINKLKIYSGAEHPHKAQQPKALNV